MSKALPHAVEDFTEAGPLFREPPAQRPHAHAEMLGNIGRLHLAAGKRADELVFHHSLQPAYGLPLRQ